MNHDALWPTNTQMNLKAVNVTETAENTKRFNFKTEGNALKRVNAHFLSDQRNIQIFRKEIGHSKTSALIE